MHPDARTRLEEPADETSCRIAADTPDIDRISEMSTKTMSPNVRPPDPWVRRLPMSIEQVNQVRPAIAPIRTSDNWIAGPILRQMNRAISNSVCRRVVFM